MKLFSSKDWLKGLILTLVLMLVTTSLNYGDRFLQANLIDELRLNVVFDGTVMPLPQTVNYEKLPDALRSENFANVGSQYKDVLPVYDASQLATGFSDRRYINAKITYTVPYLGTYELDGMEGLGSHPAVDIVALKGTPVVAVSNGIVVKVKSDDPGFGPHVAILHPEVPDPENIGSMTGLVSSYSHLDSFVVSEGQLVKKGEVIGYIGNKGFATTDHLHFQVDREKKGAYYPSWPFTNAEAKSAGLTFVEAVTKGLGREKGAADTVNPMTWVQQNLNYRNIESNSDNDNVGAQADFTDVEEAVTIEASNVAADKLYLSYEVPETLVRNQEAKLKLYLKGQSVPKDYRLINDPLAIDESGVDVYYKSGILTASSFKDGYSEVTFVPKESGQLRFKIANGQFDLKTEALSVRNFADLELNSELGRVVSKLQGAGVINGYPDGTFRPTQTVSRVEAIKLLVETLDLDTSKVKPRLSYNDIVDGAWYHDYVATAYANDLLENRLKLRPTDDVNWFEFMKMLVEAMEIDVDPTIDPQYANILDADLWYAPYWQEALRLELVSVDVSSENYAKAMTREDVAMVLNKLLARIN
jgi:hypothetical protein